MEIKPCPYPDCGGEGFMGGSPGAHFVYCKACGCTGPAQQNKPAAAQKWNSVIRSEPAKICATCVHVIKYADGEWTCRNDASLAQDVTPMEGAPDWGCILWEPSKTR